MCHFLDHALILRERSWIALNVAGKYIVEVELEPAQLTAYDAAWLKIN